MPQFEVMYKVLQNNIKETQGWSSTGPSDYKTVVTAPYHQAAEQLVRNMNGGNDHCYIVYTKQI